MADTGEKSLRSRKYAEARRALFGAAMQLFIDKGFDETSVDEIVARAGFSRATFFNHFGTKSAVLRYYGEALQERVHQMLMSIDAGMPSLERIKQVLLAMATDAQSHREELKLVFAHSLRDEAYLAHPTRARQRTLKMLADLIAEGQLQGDVRRDLSAEEQARQVLGLYNNAVLTIIFGGRNARAAIEPMWSFAIGGIDGRGTLAK
ncbi:MAG: TetR/AcrR family transcriptional regulator [Acidobacteriaceae bacterium]